MTKKTLEAFREAHDPTYQLNAVSETFHRDIRWKPGSRAIVVAAQNATPVHKDWWGVLGKMAEVLNAELVVIPLRYKNPTSAWTASQRNAEWWAPEVRPYLWNVREDLNENVMVLGDVKIQPTMQTPLSDLDAVSRASSAVVGHVRAQTRSVATPQNKMAKLMMTSGACTVENYSDSRIGRLAQFHHSLSAVLVEIRSDKVFHMRRLNYSPRTKRVIDLGTAYSAKGSVPAPPSLALVMGDTHVEVVDPTVLSATFGPRGICEATRPGHLIWHDLLDGYAVNPHTVKDPFIAYAKAQGARGDVAREVETALGFLQDWHSAAKAFNPKVQSLVVPANHNDFLMRWLRTNDWREDPRNAEFYLETALQVLRATRSEPNGTHYPDPFTTKVNALGDPNIRGLGWDESFTLAGVELGMHGQAGPNGARGSIKNLRRVATKSVIGHSHSPGEDEGCTQVGTSTYLRLDYNHGPSSWLNTHCDLNADGKRQLLTIVEGQFAL